MRGCTCHGLTLCPQCTALAERAGVLAPPEAPMLSERAFQDAVVRLARERQYLVYHTHDSRRSPSGFPDLVCAKAGAPLLLLELKTATGQVTQAQHAWLEALALAQGKEVYTWTPDNWALIAARLRG